MPRGPIDQSQAACGSRKKKTTLTNMHYGSDTTNENVLIGMSGIVLSRCRTFLGAIAVNASQLLDFSRLPIKST